MLVDKTEIEKAKEKLGVNNAFLMAELLELEDFDEKNLKAKCCYHEEDSASFIYNKKNYTMHCFGCNKTVDIVDVIMEKENKSFLDATKKLFEIAGMEYSYGEQHVKTKNDYKYPYEDGVKNGERVIEYLGKRGISKNTVDYLDVREDKNGNCVLNYYNTDDVLMLVKYRPSHTVQKPNPKTWCQHGADTTPLLFNMNRVNTTKPLLITEGEVDCMSCIEAGYLNTVSCPLGAGNTGWIAENWDWLEQFEEIIIFSDNDAPGIKMRKECVNRLGSWRCKFIELPEYYTNGDGKRYRIKDANDALQAGGKEYLMNVISKAKDIPVDGVVDYADIEEADMSQMDGVTIGIKELDQEIGKLYYGTLTIITGKAGAGKSSLIDQIIGHAIDDDIPVFLYSQEMQNKITTGWMNHIFAGRRNLVEKKKSNGDSYYVVPYDTQRKMQEHYRGKLYMYEDDQSNSEDVVLEKLEGCIRKYGVRFAVIDNLMGLVLKGDSKDKNDDQTNFVNRLIKLAAKYNIAIAMISHPRKAASGMTSEALTLDDIAGSSNIGNLAHRSIAIRRVTPKEKEDPKNNNGKYDCLISVLKDRILGKVDVQIGVFYDRVSRRFYTCYSEFDHQYGWDATEYRDKLPYVDRNQINPANKSPFDA